MTGSRRAALLAWAAKTSLGLLMGVALFGYIGRLAVITAAVLAISGQSWSAPIPLCATLVLTHFVKPTAETFSTTLKPFLIFALATSLTSSAFYMKKLRAMPKQQVITGSD